MIKEGTYAALAGGYTTVFTVGKDTCVGVGPRGVRGINIKDTVSIEGDKAVSTILGPLTSISKKISLVKKTQRSNSPERHKTMITVHLNMQKEPT